MMNFITKQQKKFQNLVTNYFVSNYKLKPVYISNNNNGINLEEGNLYIYKNNVILNNKIVKAHFNIKESLDQNNYSFFNILYKNIEYKQKNENYIGEINKKIKKNIIYDKKKLDLKFKNLEKVVNIIGRKYKNNDTTISSAFGLQCIINEPKNNNDVIKKEKILSSNLNINITAEQKQKFLGKLHDNRVYLDLEYINDIYDDFNSFPISNDNSMIFMIGLVEENENYINFTTDKLNKKCEEIILEKYIDFIKNKTKNGEMLHIYHWSSADYTGIIKGFERHPKLKKEYIEHCEKHVKYIDLLYIVKDIISLDSYSLKYVAKVLLKKEYTTECKNGFDAMINIIIKNSELKENDILQNYNETIDIIKYNEMDTILLLDLTRFFCN